MATHYDGYRAGSGEPLVLLHGATTSWRVWQPVLDELTQRYDVLAPTMPGDRAGPPVSERLSIDTLVDGVEETLDNADIRTADLAGNSLGGIVALELLRRGRARSVVNFNGPFAWRDDHDITRLIRIFAVNERLIRSGLLRVLLRRNHRTRRHALRPMMNRADKLSPDQVSTLLADVRHCVIAKPLARTLLAEGPRPCLDIGATPVHIAWSHTDRIVPFERYGAPTLAQVPGARLTRMPGVGHVPMWDNPQLVVQIIDRAISALR